MPSSPQSIPLREASSSGQPSLMPPLPHPKKHLQSLQKTQNSDGGLLSLDARRQRSEAASRRQNRLYGRASSKIASTQVRQDDPADHSELSNNTRSRCDSQNIETGSPQRQLQHH
jgi:hypothetical protein